MSSGRAPAGKFKKPRGLPSAPHPVHPVPCLVSGFGPALRSGAPGFRCRSQAGGRKGRGHVTAPFFLSHPFRRVTAEMPGRKRRAGCPRPWRQGRLWALPLPQEARRELRWMSGVHARPGKETDSCCENTAPPHRARAGEAKVCDKVKRAVGPRPRAGCPVPRETPGSASAPHRRGPGSVVKARLLAAPGRGGNGGRWWRAGGRETKPPSSRLTRGSHPPPPRP